MGLKELFAPELADTPFESYGQYAESLFACVDCRLSDTIGEMKTVFASGDGGYKNVLYPDLETAHDRVLKRLAEIGASSSDELPEPGETEDLSALDGLFAGFAGEPAQTAPETLNLSAADMLAHTQSRAAASDVPLPLYFLCRKLELSPFAAFCLACAVLASTQTNYAAVFQVVNQNGSAPLPTIESAGRVYYGRGFSITDAYGDMSQALEQLAPVLDMKVNEAMPFATVLSPDKRLIDFLFGPNPKRPDEKYSRFFAMLTNEEDLDPLIANAGQLDALEIAYQDGARIFALFGDEGSGRRFTIRHFCKNRGIGCVTLDCGKLFSYDFAFVEKALWAVTRECILTESCCGLNNLGYREEEKERFFGYIDLAFFKLTEKKITVFTASREKLPLREITALEYASLELETPNFGEREKLWRHYAVPYTLDDEVDLPEMATKFLFTPGKIKSALHMSRSLSAMKKLEKVSRACLFEACYNQMSHELTQKATKIKATYSWDDIVMSKDQRQSLEYACDQMRFRRQVYEQWDYNRKYPYGRGLSVLLFGAPGTGKSMCAQVLANALNLELYRVDLSKVVDKYVGETEKSISMIFREAKKCNVVLFFDECDTLFAKRSDDGGSGQASNNNKTALLLQEVEAYDGVSVLATNYKHNIDPAFFRRMKFIVEFQFPDPETRYILWNATIPKNTPLAEDVDVRFLADRFEFVGGNIKNCILNAAFLAAGDPEAGGEVHMKHYLMAIRYEFVKTGKVFTKADFEPYAKLIL
ncbi:MAG: ATP-binding protein [Oscillospiraceae bacterium]|nr:ATP-binding protein [Oscillospiraceae bacterium]